MKFFFLINLFLYSFFSIAINYRINQPYVPVFINFPKQCYEKLETYEKAVTQLKGDTCIKQIDQYLYNESVTKIPNLLDEELVFVEKNQYNCGGIKPQDFNKLSVVSYAKYSPRNTSVMIISPVFEHESIKYSMGTVLCIDRKILLNNTDSIAEVSQIKSLEIDKKRVQIISLAKKLIGRPYQWGGRTALEGGGYDCAGLVNIVYLASGLDIPRSVTYQYDKSIDINNSHDLLLGDLIFCCDITNYDSPIHVMLYTGKEQGKHTYIHATPETMNVAQEVYESDEIINNTLIAGTNYKLKLRRLLLLSSSTDIND